MSEQPAPDGPRLSGTQKVAVVLMQLPPASAASLMAQFSENEAQEIAAEIVRLRRVPASVADSVISDFHTHALSGRRAPRGGRHFAAALLEASFGPDKAAGLMENVSSSMAGKSFDFLEPMSAEQIAELIDGELPQTMAMILAHLRPGKASAVLAQARLRAGHRSGPLHRHDRTCGGRNRLDRGWRLKDRAGSAVLNGKPSQNVGGIQPLVDIITRADTTTERTVLEGLDVLDAELAGEVRAQMLTFKDIVRLERRDLQRLLRTVSPAVLAVALKGASSAVLEAVRSNISNRNKEILASEMANSGPVRASQVEEARAQIVRSIREEAADGTIVIRRPEDEDFVE